MIIQTAKINFRKKELLKKRKYEIPIALDVYRLNTKRYGTTRVKLPATLK